VALSLKERLEAAQASARQQVEMAKRKMGAPP
jgi:hypothetical protein